MKPKTKTNCPTMKKRFNLFAGLITVVIALCFSFSVYAPETQAKADNDFSKPFGLIVHNGNQVRYIPRIKALNVLMDYFNVADKPKYKYDAPVLEDVDFDSRAYPTIRKGCEAGLFSCSIDLFEPGKAISQRDFLNWFFKLKYANQPSYLLEKYSYLPNSYLRDWLEARRLNLLSENDITYTVLQEFLYRNSVVELNLNYPYREGLTLNFDEVNADNYHSLREINQIVSALDEIITSYKGNTQLTVKEKHFVDSITKQRDAFDALKTSLIDSPYVVQQNPNLNPEVTRLVREYGLQDVLETYSYDYSHNAAYRKHNLTTGVSKMNGKLFMPGDVLDYWSIISDKNLWDFQFGWVIAEGKEQWQFGGGICGSSSMVFLPSWKSGLEIVERNSHSIYYKGLYPLEYIGLDATVYRPRPNLKIRNNMDSPIVFNVMDDKEKQVITVQIIGNKQYKSVKIEGPIFESRTSVKWIRHMEDFDGSITSEVLASRYNAIH